MSFNSCLDCPSHLTATEASEFFGDASIKVSMCARFGYLLGEPAAVGQVEIDTERARVKGSKCPSHGDPRPSVPTEMFQPLLFLPDSSRLNDAPNDSSVDNCFSCKNMFMSDKHGLYGCAARGLVVFNSRRVEMAQNKGNGCTWRSNRNGVPIPSEASPELIPEFNLHVRGPAPRKALFTVVEPRYQDSDAPVADSDKGVIRAWREIQLGNKDMEKGGRKICYPIFETSYFGEDEQFIPHASSEEGDPSLYVDHAGLMNRFMSIGYKLDKVTSIIGDPGSGKTTGVRHISWAMNMPFFPINYNESTDLSEVLGIVGLEKGTTLLQPGRLPLIWQKPGVYLGDELNLAEEGIKQAHRSMFDSSKELIVYDKIFRRHDYCFPFVAINPSWDFKNIGAREMASADVRRMSYFYMPMPDADMQKRIIKAAVKKINDYEIPLSVVEVIVKASQTLQKMASENKIAHHWTLAQDIKVAQFSQDWTLEEAYKMAYFYYAEPTSAAVALATIKTYFPSGM